jgi:hypothetical protein
MGHVVVISTAWVDPNLRLDRGDIYADDDPIVLAHPSFFTDDPIGAGLAKSSSVNSSRLPGSETATAAPGERRDVAPADAVRRGRPIKDNPQA